LPEYGIKFVKIPQIQAVLVLMRRFTRSN